MRYSETKSDKIAKHLRGTIYARCRERAGFVKQQDAVKALGFKTPYQLSVYETGKADPPINVLLNMSRVYKMSIDEILNNPYVKYWENEPFTEQELIECIERIIARYHNNKRVREKLVGKSNTNKEKKSKKK